MKIFAPSYYKDFKCIADKCKHNCCIGWEIDIDTDTLEYYRSLNNDLGNEIMKNISLEDVPHFKLTANDRCPLLNEKGLCKIISLVTTSNRSSISFHKAMGFTKLCLIKNAAYKHGKWVGVTFLEKNVQSIVVPSLNKDEPSYRNKVE